MNCCLCSKTCAMVMTGVAGAAIGVLATHALDARPVTQPQTPAEHVAFQPEIDPEAQPRTGRWSVWFGTVPEYAYDGTWSHFRVRLPSASTHQRPQGARPCVGDEVTDAVSAQSG